MLHVDRFEHSAGSLQRRPEGLREYRNGFVIPRLQSGVVLFIEEPGRNAVLVRRTLRRDEFGKVLVEGISHGRLSTQRRGAARDLRAL